MKFTNVTWLDATRFLESSCTAGFAEVAIRLQQLRHMEIKSVVGMLNISDEALEKLRAVTSLRIGPWMSKVSGGCLQKFSCLSLQEMRIDCRFTNIEQSLKPFHQLKSLALNQSFDDLFLLSENCLLKSLEKLKLTCRSSGISKLTALTSLAELECTVSTEEEFCLQNLPKLTSLELLVEPRANGLLSRPDLHKTLSKLSSLAIFCEENYPSLHLLERLPKLKHLSLAKVRFDGSQMKSFLSSVTSLVLLGCEIEEKDTFTSSLKTVQKLCLLNPVTLPSMFVLPFDGDLLPELKTLLIKASHIVGCAESNRTLEKLETLCVQGEFRQFCSRTGLGGDWLNSMPSLRELGLQYKEDCTEAEGLLNRNLLSRLDTLCIDAAWDDPWKRKDFLQALREMETGLKLEFSIVDFWQFLANGS